MTTDPERLRLLEALYEAVGNFLRTDDDIPTMFNFVDLDEAYNAIEQYDAAQGKEET